MVNIRVTIGIGCLLVGLGLMLGSRLPSTVEAPSIAFVSVDGRDVNTSELVGHVVLIDFWATWCAPCRQEVPTLVAVYNKYHPQGLEIIGISLDKDRDALTTYTNAHRIEWPQYFDGLGWDNSISSPLGIREIPAIWLINKQGKLVSRNATTGLDVQIEKLLRE